MKIVFFVSCIHSKSKGNGGHYHSLLTLYKALSPKNELLIINIGTDKSDTLEKEDIKLYNIISPTFDFKTTKQKIIKILDTEKPDIIHAFDHFVLFWARIVNRTFKIPFCITKCGGANPKVYFPYCDNIILYSNENYNYFVAKKKFKNSNIQLIPNRVFPFSVSDIRIKKLIKEFPAIENFNFKFLRICRIGNAYKNSLVQSINLIDQLTEKKYSCCLIVIGAIEDEEVLSEIKGLSNQNSVFIVSDPKFNKNAKELIGFSDFVLGTGRSFMEASCQGKILLSPIKNSDIPLLINEKNLKRVLDFNISERFTMADYDRNSNYEEIESLLNDVSEYKRYSSFSREVFDNNFNIENVLIKYQQFYENLKKTKSDCLSDLFLHFLYLKRAYKVKN